MTREEYIAKTGNEPENDDLERVNCPQAGMCLHSYCGWCPTHDKPRFQCGCENHKEVHTP